MDKNEQAQRFHVLAMDYDETLAVQGRVSVASIHALDQVKHSGRKLALVTGRRLSELLAIFPEIKMFDRVVAENGGTLYDPENQSEKALSTVPPIELISALEEKKIPFAIGRVLLASKVPYEKIIVQVIRELGLEHHIIFNKGSVMILPSGVNKATGLTAALEQLGISGASTVGVGDGENDHAFLELCGYSVAVANAVESLKKSADWVTPSPAEAGVRELIDRLLVTPP